MKSWLSYRPTEIERIRQVQCHCLCQSRARDGGFRPNLFLKIVLGLEGIQLLLAGRLDLCFFRWIDIR